MEIVVLLGFLIYTLALGTFLVGHAVYSMLAVRPVAGTGFRTATRRTATKWPLE